jgi:tungstate transport system ATP-binding protein
MSETTSGKSDIIYRVRDVAKVYDGRQVLRIESLNIYRGEMLALVGPSGAGKSTLLRLLNFLEYPDQGEIRFQDQVYRQGEPMPLGLRRQVTTVFQRPILLQRSVQANVGYGLRLRGERDGIETIHAALAQVGLDHLSRQRARKLSGGEMQRVALARAIILEPKVLLLDEPTANLDPYNVGLIEEIVLRLNRELGTTIVLVTHNIFQARRMAQRIGLILEGRLIEIGQAETLLEEPADPRTAAFVRGEMVY